MTSFEELWIRILMEMGFNPRRFEKLSYTDEHECIVECYPTETKIFEKDGKLKMCIRGEETGSVYGTLLYTMDIQLNEMGFPVEISFDGKKVSVSKEELKELLERVKEKLEKMLPKEEIEREVSEHKSKVEHIKSALDLFKGIKFVNKWDWFEWGLLEPVNDPMSYERFWTVLLEEMGYKGAKLKSVEYLIAEDEYDLEVEEEPMVIRKVGEREVFARLTEGKSAYMRLVLIKDDYRTGLIHMLVHYEINGGPCGYKINFEFLGEEMSVKLLLVQIYDLYYQKVKERIMREENITEADILKGQTTYEEASKTLE
ncbi:MAG: hypothetical protein ACPLRS_02800, partial [Hydrogenobacter sp.]